MIRKASIAIQMVVVFCSKPYAHQMICFTGHVIYSWTFRMDRVFTLTLHWGQEIARLTLVLVKVIWLQSARNKTNTRDTVSSGYPNTEKRVENTTRSTVFLTKFEVLGQMMKHCLSCLIYLLNRDKNYVIKGEVKSSKSMLIKTGYPNLLHGHNFVCLNLMNY